MNTPRGYFVFRNQLWRLPALLLLAVVFAAGDHALEVGNLNIYVGELDPTGNALISYVYSNDGGRYSTLRTQVRDAHTFKVLHTIALQRPLRGDVFLSVEGQAVRSCEQFMTAVHLHDKRVKAECRAKQQSLRGAMKVSLLRGVNDGGGGKEMQMTVELEWV